MKKLNLFTLLLIMVLIGINRAQSQTMSCCSSNTSQQFAMLGNDPSFLSAHLAPLSFHYVPVNGKMVTFKTDDGKTGSAYEVKASNPTNKYVIMVHEWWGLNDYIKQEAEKLQGELGDVNVLAIDLYDGKVGDTPEKAGEIMKAMNEDRAHAIIRGAISYAGPKAKIQTIGWCFGGGWSLQAALEAGRQSVGCVMYYGMPETLQSKLRLLSGPVLGIFANKDKWITPAVVEQFKKDMKTANKELILKQYDADHAFANPSNPKYEKEMAEKAHTIAVMFIKSNFL